MQGRAMTRYTEADMAPGMGPSPFVPPQDPGQGQSWEEQQRLWAGGGRSTALSGYTDATSEWDESGGASDRGDRMTVGDARYTDATGRFTQGRSTRGNSRYTGASEMTVTSDGGSRYTEGDARHTDATGRFTHGDGRYTQGTGRDTDATRRYTDADARYTRGDARYTRGDARYTQGDARYTQGDARYTQGDARYTQGDARYTQGDARYTQGDARYTQGDARYTQGDARYTQGDARYTQGDARYTQGELEKGRSTNGGNGGTQQGRLSGAYGAPREVGHVRPEIKAAAANGGGQLSSDALGHARRTSPGGKGGPSPPVSSSGHRGGRRAEVLRPPKMPPSITSVIGGQGRGAPPGRGSKLENVVPGAKDSIGAEGKWSIPWTQFPELSTLWGEHFEPLADLLVRLGANVDAGMEDVGVKRLRKSHGMNKLSITEEGQGAFQGFSHVPNTAAVMREGRQVELLAEDLVPGDLVLGVMGSRAAADIRIIECSSDLRCDMSPIGLPTTDGKGRGHARNSTEVQETVGVWEAKNLIFMGCQVLQGSYKGIVVKTGMSCALGVVAQEMGWAEGGGGDFGTKFGRFESAFEGKTAAIAIQMGLADETGRCRCTVS